MAPILPPPPSPPLKARSLRSAQPHALLRRPTACPSAAPGTVHAPQPTFYKKRAEARPRKACRAHSRRVRRTGRPFPAHPRIYINARVRSRPRRSSHSIHSCTFHCAEAAFLHGCKNPLGRAGARPSRRMDIPARTRNPESHHAFAASVRGIGSDRSQVSERCERSRAISAR